MVGYAFGRICVYSSGFRGWCSCLLVGLWAVSVSLLVWLYLIVVGLVCVFGYWCDWCDVR